ncbi:hypothetical protein BDN72DRAFT_960581 [Pluteus cervinus]|uniref:Uncharacterized protein n=1 Tax=Pluteus cervinus TaxID=181527 RepID=A0ACD3AQ96_9AGAR|nr:hypothetical protein BDN72DRAFT_960581 [Pluteus cervinus]
MAPSFAELRERAGKVTEAGLQKAQNVKDHHTSVPLKSTNWDPYTKQPAPAPKPKPPAPPKPSYPPPPSAHNRPAAPPAPSPFTSKPKPYIPPHLEPVRDDLAPPPPPPRRGPSSPSPAAAASSSPSFSPSPPPLRASAKPSPGLLSTGPPPVLDRGSRPGPSRFTRDTTQIDWANLSKDDKEVFFSWLDEFFSRHLNIDITPRTKAPLSSPPVVPSSTKPSLFRAPSSITPRSPANPFRASASSSPGPTPLSSSSTAFTLSYPPATQHGSAALDLAHYFSPSTPWPDHWYNKSTMTPPPPLVGSKDIYWSSSWQSHGQTKTVFIGILYSDLSVFWGTVEFQMSNPGTTKREAQYLPVPPALSKRELEEAHKTYGETIASFAESFLGTGEYCARGECWDLANEALKYFNEFDYVPKPVRSISRTHGHLIFEGKANRGGAEMVGRWRGGDDRVRRGDIVEWRTVKISTKGPGGRVMGWAVLGDPDHTAVVVQDTIPTVNVQDGGSITPKQLGSIVVVEQSVGSPPAKKEYVLDGMEEGEMWIYRPVSMEMYLGINEVVAKAPQGNTRLLRL